MSSLNPLNKDSKLINDLKNLNINSFEILKIVELFEKYEKNNLTKIKKLNRIRLIETNRVKGGLKQTINCHGPITKELIGSATKRIMGNLLSNEKPKLKLHLNSFFWGAIITILITLII
jgi:hypothetical protein